MPTDLDLAGHTAVVTGAGRGLGRAYALRLAERGAAIVVNSLTDRCRVVAEEIRAAGWRAVAVEGDVAEPETGRRLSEAALDEFGSLEIVVNNAGRISPGRFEDLSVGQWDDLMGVHLRGAFLVTQPAWRVMRAAGYGRVILTSSSSGLFSHQGMANYATVKAGLYGMTKALAFEGAEFGIRTNVLLSLRAGVRGGGRRLVARRPRAGVR
ncbi:hypothetical protein GCM10009547_01510 [Sporichthya brevicatena]|uniref:SDR family NAD(P)-dependent oxidoreductase n=1 Tax=Sporichthya brevicatena TaxID=171442 RepID=A0ABP3RBF2_9ACTN